MLILTRKVKESVVIQVPPSTETQTILVRLVEQRGDRSRLGFTAEREVTIHREELVKVASNG